MRNKFDPSTVALHDLMSDDLIDAVLSPLHQNLRLECLQEWYGRVLFEHDHEIHRANGGQHLSAFFFHKYRTPRPF